jgi:hypothetical protein
MVTAGEPPPGKEPVMRVLRIAAVFVVLGMIIGAPWAAAAKPRQKAHTQLPMSLSRNVLTLVDYLKRLLASFGTGDALNLAGICSPESPGCWATNGQVQNSEAGCGADPLGSCSPNH